jgi:hypothetical protein
MAATKNRGRIDAPKPRSDVYTGLLLISLLAMIAGCVLLYLDYSDYDAMKAPPAVNVPAPKAPDAKTSALTPPAGFALADDLKLPDLAPVAIPAEVKPEPIVPVVATVPEKPIEVPTIQQAAVVEPTPAAKPVEVTVPVPVVVPTAPPVAAPAPVEELKPIQVIPPSGKGGDEPPPLPSGRFVPPPM